MIKASDRPFSVVVAMGESGNLAHVLDVLAAQAPLVREVVVVGDGATRATAGHGTPLAVRAIEMARATLVPERWAAGIAHTRGHLVALTALPCLPGRDWLASLARVLESNPDCAAAGGGIDPPRQGRSWDDAAYVARYHGFLASVTDDPVDDLPGENVAYRRADLDAVWQENAAGFWENEVHRGLRAHGKTLRRSASVRVRQGTIGSPWRFARARARHGAHYAAARPASTPERWARALTTPLLPAVLIARMTRRVLRHQPRSAGRLLAGMPWLILFVGAWSLGELRGYLVGRR